MRVFNIISSKDDLGLNTIFINKIAKEIGLISSFGKMVIVKINGVKLGMNYLVEHHSKEWFEREIRLTNYAMIRSNDDWNTQTPGHNDYTDLLLEDKEISGPSRILPVAMGQMDNLLNAVKNKDYTQMSKLIDIEYMAKFMALLTLINDSHQITGDNIRYVYDFTLGKFKIIFRMEGNELILINNSVNEFNSSLFTASEYSNSFSHDIFKILISNKDFRSKRDRFLNELVSMEEYLLKELKNVYEENNNVILHSDENRRRISYHKNKFSVILNRNIDSIKKYLDYAKIYISIERKEKLSRITVFNDSYQKQTIKKILTQANQDSTPLEISTDLTLLPINRPNLKYTKSVAFDIFTNDSIVSFDIYNTTTSKKLKGEHIYIVEKETVFIPPDDLALKMLNKNGIKFVSDDDGITIKKGNYKIYNNIVFPIGTTVTIEKGTNIKIDKNVSLLFQGSFYALGSKDSPITIDKIGSGHFGTLAIVPQSIESECKLNYFYLSGGGEANINGIDFTTQLGIYNTSALIQNSRFSNSTSDDGLNIKNSKVDIQNSYFYNNYADQIDLDFCTGPVKNNFFYFESGENNESNSNGDGLDISGSNVIILNNSFKNFSDKGISVGEQSIAYVNNNTFSNNNSAITVKDGSVVFAEKNSYSNNQININLYIKKSFYDLPIVYFNNYDDTSKVVIEKGKIFLEKNLSQAYEEYIK